MKIQNKKELSQRKREFLLTFFPKEDKYCEIEINKFWLVKNWNNGKKIWQVGIYSQESFMRYKNPTQSEKLF